MHSNEHLQPVRPHPRAQEAVESIVQRPELFETETSFFRMRTEMQKGLEGYGLTQTDDVGAISRIEKNAMLVLWDKSLVDVVIGRDGLYGIDVLIADVEKPTRSNLRDMQNATKQNLMDRFWHVGPKALVAYKKLEALAAVTDTTATDIGQVIDPQ